MVELYFIPLSPLLDKSLAHSRCSLSVGGIEKQITNFCSVYRRNALPCLKKKQNVEYRVKYQHIYLLSTQTIVYQHISSEKKKITVAVMTHRNQGMWNSVIEGGTIPSPDPTKCWVAAELSWKQNSVLFHFHISCLLLQRNPVISLSLKGHSQ